MPVAYNSTVKKATVTVSRANPALQMTMITIIDSEYNRSLIMIKNF